jgi:hypothetical protein
MSYQPPQGYPPQGGQWPEQGPGYPPTPPPTPGYPGAQPYPGAPQGFYQPMPGTYPAEQPDSRGGVAIAALILGIVSLPLSITIVCGLPVAIAGIICGALGRGSTSRKTMATVGLALSILGIVIPIAFFAFGTYLINTGIIPVPTPTLQP